MLAVLPERARTIVLTATFTGLRKSELRGLTWGSYNGEQLSVEPSVWNSTVSEPKTKRSRSPIPVVRPLAEALEARKAPRRNLGAIQSANLPGWKRQTFESRQYCAARHYASALDLRDLW
jgi:integrase